MTETIQQLKEDIAVLQEKLNKLEEIEKQPKMTLENEGKFEIVSYNDKCYVRMDYSYDTLWYMSKNTKDFDGNNLILITDDETRNILEGLRFNKVKIDVIDEPPEYDEIEHDMSENVENKTIRQVIDRWWIDTFTSKNQWDVDTCIDDLADQVQFWIMRNKK